MKENWLDFEERFIIPQKRQKTAIELIPRDEKSLKQEIRKLEKCDYDIINLPHLSPKQNWRIKFLSPVEIVEIENLLPENKDLILHLRTQDSKNIKEVLERINFLLTKKVSDILLITWDVYKKNDNLITTGKILDNILNDKSSAQQGDFSPLSVSADLYLDDWWNFNKKIEFLQQSTKSKIFTQPIFIYETIEEIEKNIKNFWLNHNKEEIFWGITWFSNLKQRDYWKNVNKVPEDFLPRWYTNKIIKETSLARATEIYKQLKKKWFSNYIMLMKESVDDLIKIQNRAENILY